MEQATPHRTTLVSWNLLFVTSVSLVLSTSAVFTSFQSAFQIFPWISSLLVSVSYLTTILAVNIRSKRTCRCTLPFFSSSSQDHNGTTGGTTSDTLLDRWILEEEPLWISLAALCLLLSFVGLSVQGGSHYTLPLNTILLSLTLVKATRMSSTFHLADACARRRSRRSTKDVIVHGTVQDPPQDAGAKRVRA